MQLQLQFDYFLFQELQMCSKSRFVLKLKLNVWITLKDLEDFYQETTPAALSKSPLIQNIYSHTQRELYVTCGSHVLILRTLNPWKKAINLIRVQNDFNIITEYWIKGHLRRPLSSVNTPEELRFYPEPFASEEPFVEDLGFN